MASFQELWTDKFDSVPILASDLESSVLGSEPPLLQQGGCPTSMCCKAEKETEFQGRLTVG